MAMMVAVLICANANAQAPPPGPPTAEVLKDFTTSATVVNTGNPVLDELDAYWQAKDQRNAIKNGHLLLIDLNLGVTYSTSLYADEVWNTERTEVTLTWKYIVFVDSGWAIPDVTGWTGWYDPDA